MRLAPSRGSWPRGLRFNELIAIALALIAWTVWAAALPLLPVAVRFAITFTLFVLGPGIAGIALLARDVDSLERWVLALAAGLLLTSAIAQLFGALDIIAAYPATVVGLGGFGLARGFLQRGHGVPPVRKRDIAACAVVAALALAAAVVAYAHRLVETPAGVTIYGDYDTFDSTYYAAISGELANEIPPRSPFRAGHPLGYSYQSHLLPAMIQRFADVSVVDLYFRYVWPAYLLIASLTVFATIRRISSSGVALLASCLVFLGSDFSYVAAHLRPSGADWDRMIWSNNWLTPGAEQLFFNTWTPTLAILCLGLWALDRHEADDRARWLVVAAACFASLLQFKPFAFGAVIVGLIGSAAFSWSDNKTRQRFLLVLGGTVLLALPYAYRIVFVYDESQAVLRIANGYGEVIPSRVVHQLGLRPVLSQMMDPLGDTATATVSIVLANLLFIVGGLGARLVALPGLCRVLISKRIGSAWRLIGWTIVAGAAIPFVVVTEPNNQSFNVYHTSLYLLWFVAARDVLLWTRWRPTQLLIAVALIGLAVPSTIHYLRVKWQDVPFAFVHRDYYTIADRLRQQERDGTVFLQRYPHGPSYLVLFSGRHTVLAWSGYARNSAGLAQEIDSFFRSADGDGDSALRTLAQHRVTHVVETKGVDRIHPRVIACLALLLETEILRLYAVRSDEGCATPRVFTASLTASSAPSSVREGA